MPPVMNMGMNFGQPLPYAGMYAGGYPPIDPQYNPMVGATNPGAFMQLLDAGFIPPMQVQRSDKSETPLSNDNEPNTSCNRR